MKGGIKINKMVLDLERKSRITLSILAFVAILIFFLTTLGVSGAATIGTAIIGFLIGAILLIESSIVSYIKESRWKRFTFGDVAVILGVTAGTALIVFSAGLIPMIGEILPTVVTNFTTSFARIIAGISLVIVGIFAFTPKFK